MYYHHLDGIAKQICFRDDASALHSKDTRFETIHGEFASSYQSLQANARK